MGIVDITAGALIFYGDIPIPGVLKVAIGGVLLIKGAMTVFPYLGRILGG